MLADTCLIKTSCIFVSHRFFRQNDRPGKRAETQEDCSFALCILVTITNVRTNDL